MTFLRAFRMAICLTIILSSVSQTREATAQMANTQKPGKYVPWVSYETAMEQAYNHHRPVMMLFNGSDWSPESREFTINVLATESFAGWSSRTVVKVEVDFPRYRTVEPQLQQLNEQLRQRYREHIKQLPTILFIDADGKVLGKMEYEKGTPSDWLQRAKEKMRNIRMPDLVA